MKNNNRKCYYAVYASNGLGIFKDKEKLETALYYLRDYRQKERLTFAEAHMYAIEGYNGLLREEGARSGYYPNEIMREDWCYYRKDLYKNNARDVWNGRVFG